MPLIMTGPGIFHLIEVEKLPETGDEINLGSAMLSAGVYEVTHNGEQLLKGERFPFYTHRRLRDLPSGAKVLPAAIMNC